MSTIYYFTAAVVLLLSYLAEHASAGSSRDLDADENARRRPNAFFAFLLAIFLIIVAGFRYYVGTDYGAYYKYFTGGWPSFWETLFSFNEPGMTLISTIGRGIYNDGISAIFGASLITIALYASQIYKYSPMFTVSMLLYLFVGDWHGSFNGVRQYLAAAVLFAGHRYIVDRKFWKYAFTVFIAALFHKSALVMIVPYFLLTRKLDWKQIFILAAGAVIIRFSYGTVFEVIGSIKEGTYASEEYANSSVRFLRLLVQFVPVIVFAFLCRKGNYTKKETFYLNGMLLNSFTWLSAGGSTYLVRIGIYTNAISLIGYPYLFARIPNKNTRKAVAVAAMALFFIFWWYDISNSGALAYNWWFNY